MDNFGDVLGSLGDLIGELFDGEAASAGGVLNVAALFSPDGRRTAAPAAGMYERYLCGGPRQLNINDR